MGVEGLQGRALPREFRCIAIMELGFQNHSKDGFFLWPNFIMVEKGLRGCGFGVQGLGIWGVGV